MVKTEVILSLSETLPSDCGDDIALPTPTPGFATPVEPTPTQLNQHQQIGRFSMLSSETHTRVDTFGGSAETIVENDVNNSGKPISVLKYQGYDSGGTLCVDLRLTSGWEDDTSALAKFVAFDSNPSGVMNNYKKLKK